jgi:uncharacterized protein YoxC
MGYAFAVAVVVAVVLALRVRYLSKVLRGCLKIQTGLDAKIIEVNDENKSLTDKVETHAGYINELKAELEKAENDCEKIASLTISLDEANATNDSLTERLSQADEKLAAMALQPTVKKKRAAKKLETKKKKAA